jgi:glucose-6-phosphate dehydrogenase assembly protein OpcA
MAATMTAQSNAVPSGIEVPVNYSDIERSLAELWRGAQGSDAEGLTRAALWNVVAHTDNSQQHAFASETLGRASASVPQRTIVVRAEPQGPAQMSSWISANCHRVGGDKQVCSEEISIMAGGERVARIPPLVNALLIPDMPVAMWWVGDLPNEQADYVTTLLDPADWIIVDSADFNSVGDLELVTRLTDITTTAPADLNWVRLEEWRQATASIFDGPAMRERLRGIRRVKVTATTGDSALFGHRIEALFYAAWLSAQAQHEVASSGTVRAGGREVEYVIQEERRLAEAGSIASVEITFEEGCGAIIRRSEELGVVTAIVKGVEHRPETVTRTQSTSTEELIVRQLKRTDYDRVFRRVLPLATRLARVLR